MRNIGISALKSRTGSRGLTRLDQAACCSMDDAKNVDEQSAWVTCATFLLACLTHWPSSVTDPCAAAAMHNDASTDGLRKRPDIAVFRAVVTPDPHR